MRCNWRRWLWGLIPLMAVGLTAAHLERGAIERDLAERAKRTLADKGVHWAEVTFDGRDANLRGGAVDDSQPGEAEAALRHVWGVREVDNNAVLPPKVEPFLWSARRRGNRVRLNGYVPNRATRQVIIGMANAALPGLEVADRMHVARGAPPADTWIAGLSFALKQLASLKRGTVRLENLALSIEGEAEDAAAYRAVSAVLKGDLPKGITLAKAKIAAPAVSPYTWSAQFAGGQLVLSGHVAGESSREELLAASAAAPKGTDVVDRMDPAQGDPAGFARVAAAVVRELVRLQSGSADMKDAAVTVGGVAADETEAQAVRAGLRAAVSPPFTLTEQIRVREPKGEAKPAPAPGETGPKQVAPAPPPAPQANVEEPAPPAPAPQTKAEEPAPPAPAPQAKAEEPAPPAPAPQASVEEPAPPAPAPQAKVEEPTPPPPQVEPQPVQTAPSAPAPKTAAVPDAAAPPAIACQQDLDKIAASGRILFDTDSATLAGSTFKMLDRLATAAKLCPGVRIAIEGHADVEGSADHNQRLSLRRAQAVVTYLVEAGADASRLEAVGFGASRPAAPNDTVENKARNRRIEITVRR